MSFINKVGNFLFHIDYWKEYIVHKKTRKVLDHYFSTNEDNDLQSAFINNFDFPTTMTEAPVRYEPDSGDIYYTLNFKSKELFENSGTKETALSNSLNLLDKYLPLGVTQEVVPSTPIHIPDTFTLLCSIEILSENEISFSNTVKKTLLTLTKPIFLMSLIGIVIKYLAF